MFGNLGLNQTGYYNHEVLPKLDGWGNRLLRTWTIIIIDVPRAGRWRHRNVLMPYGNSHTTTRHPRRGARLNQWTADQILLPRPVFDCTADRTAWWVLQSLFAVSPLKRQRWLLNERVKWRHIDVYKNRWFDYLLVVQRTVDLAR